MWENVSFDFSNKNFIVVGASSGIGKNIAINLAEAGANVLAVARNEERLSELKAIFPEKIRTVSLDVLKADNEAWNIALGDFTKEFGKCHGGVYTAGVGGHTALKGFDDEQARRVIDTSLYGMFNFLKNVVKRKYMEKGSSFVPFASVAAHNGQKGGIAYSAAKAAVKISVQSIAKEICRDKHRINSISPGWCDTEMTENSVLKAGLESYNDMVSAHRLGIGKPEDVSGMVLFLLSDAARWITGTDVVVDGGYLLGID